MKPFLLTSICLLFAFSSCQKKSEFLSVNVITATVDDVDVRFNTVASAHYSYVSSNPSAPTLVINGATATTSIVIIIINSPTTITDTTYGSSDTNNPVSFSEMIYDQNVPNSQLDQQYITNNFVPNSTSVTITSITSTNVAGTFNGALVYSLSGTQIPSKTITNGKFNLKID